MLNKATQYYFTDLKGFGQYGLVEDDHKPFLKESKIFQLGLLNFN